MAKIYAGILGAFRGKVGPVIGSVWKGEDYVKVYAIPGNPRTEKQVYQRDRFSFCQLIASALLTAIVQVFWKQFEDSQSGYNAFISANILAQDDYDTGGPTFSGDYEKVKVTKGSLEPVASVTSATYDSGNEKIDVVWDDTVTGNGQATDKIIIVIWDSVANVAYVSTAKTRADLTETVTVPSGLTAANLKCYVGVAQGAGIPYLTGNSVFEQVDVI